MGTNYLIGAMRSVATAAFAAIAAVTLSVPATVTAGIQLLTSTLLVMGGNNNPAGLTPVMQQELGGDPRYPDPNTDKFRPVGTFGDGYIDTENNPDSPYYGWDFTRVEWPADIGLPIFGAWAYEPAQQQGVHNIAWAINQTLPTLETGEKAVAFGYSSSANVMVREMRGLQNQPGGPPATGTLEFFLMGSPNRPNGGVMQRFPGLYIPFWDIRFDGSTPVDTPYPTTDVSWQYDGTADFPLYPINLLADLNALVGSWLLHGNYFPADMNGPRALPDTTLGNITYITLKPPRLPLLLPLSYIGIPEPLLDLVEPALTVIVEWGYDRQISPGTPTTARLIPRINPITAVGDLAEAVAEGVHAFLEDLKPGVAGVPAPAAPRDSTVAVLPGPAAASRLSPQINPVASAKPLRGSGRATAGQSRRVTAGTAPATGPVTTRPAATRPTNTATSTPRRGARTAS